MVTMHDIAAKAGVAQSTVSFVLNERNTTVRISDETKQKVVEAAESLGYRRNSSARAMRTGRFGCVALLQSVQPTRSFAPQEMLNAIHDELALRDQHLTLARLPDEKLTDDQFVPKILREWMADGLLIDYIDHIPEHLIALVRRSKIPAIWMNSRQDFDCVHPQDYEAGAQATRYLLSLGHRHIAYVDWRPEWQSSQKTHYSAVDRRQAYEDVLREAQLEPRFIHRGYLGGEGTELDFATYILRDPVRPTAIVAYGRREAQTLLFAAAKMGLSVPQDLSLVTFGVSDERFFGIFPTQMVVPFREMGSLAVRLLQRKIENPTQLLPTHTLPCLLQSGETCAPPAT